MDHNTQQQVHEHTHKHLLTSKAARISNSPTTHMADFFDYFDRLESHMRQRFDAMNAEFDRVMRASSAAPSDGTTHSYSKSVTRSYNSADGGCGEEVVVERDSQAGKEVKTHSRRIGDRAVQHVTTKDLATGAATSSVTRHNLQEADDAAFDQEWAAAESKYIAPTRRGLLGNHHLHHHGDNAAQIEDKKGH